jgi:trans-aconitate methyltransferase
MPKSWKSAEIAEFIAAVAAKLKPEVHSILDLGAGDGDLAPMLMGRFPGARFHGIDHDPTRLGIVEGKLAFYVGKVDLQLGDILETPLRNGYDLVASAAALRHFGAPDKHKLYLRVHQTLAEGGLFIFGDRVRVSSLRAAQAVRELRAEEMQALAGSSKNQLPTAERRPDSPNRETISDTVYALRRAAFQEVECLYCYGDRAVFAGFK